MKNFLIFLSIVIVMATIGVIAWWTLQMNEQLNENPPFVACTEEAKLCPDGSAVGRTGPNCEFAPCPDWSPIPDVESGEPVTDEGWITKTEGGVTFSYPRELELEYVGTAEWPPEVTLLEGDFGCDVSGSELVTVEGVEYCRTIETGAAAGSTYETYTYLSHPAGSAGYMTMVTFTIQYPQCLNYDLPQQDDCLEEQELFDVDDFAHSIAVTAHQS